MTTMNKTAVYLDWDTVRRLDTKRERTKESIGRVFDRLQPAIALALQRREHKANFRVYWRVYHGWHQGKTKTADRRAFEAFAAQAGIRHGLVQLAIDGFDELVDPDGRPTRKSRSSTSCPRCLKTRRSKIWSARNAGYGTRTASQAKLGQRGRTKSVTRVDGRRSPRSPRRSAHPAPEFRSNR